MMQAAMIGEVDDVVSWYAQRHSSDSRRLVLRNGPLPPWEILARTRRSSQLAFHGERVAARAHEGDNSDRQAIRDLLMITEARMRSAAVHGCKLFESEVNRDEERYSLQ